MKILYHHRTAANDGQAVHVRELIDAFLRGGHAVLVASPEGIGRDDAPLRSMGGSRGGAARLARFVPDLLRPLAARLYSAVATRRVLAAARVFRPDFVYERHALFNHVGAEVARVLGIPLIEEVNAPLAREEAALGRIADVDGARRLELRQLLRADAIVAVTGALKSILVADGVPAERVHVIQNGVREELLGAPRCADAKARAGVAGKFVLGFVGFARPWHGLDRAVDAIADHASAVGSAGDALRNSVLLIGGDGPALPEVRALAARRGVADRVLCTGVVSRDRVAEFIDAFDVALQPLATPYASPLKLFEYLARGVCVLAPRLDNIREIVADGETAVLFDPDRPGDFAARLAAAAGDADLRARIGAAGKAHVIERGYTWTANARRVVALAQGLTRS